MIAFDTDVLSEIFNGKVAYVVRANAIPPELQFVLIVAAEEALRGWLDYIRKVESGKIKAPLPIAYDSLADQLTKLSRLNTLRYTPLAHEHYLRQKSQKLRIGTRDLRIASIALAHDATLITRNRRDFDIVPSLKLEVWN